MKALLILFLFGLAGAHAELSSSHVSINQQFAQADTVAFGRCLSIALRDPNQPTEKNGQLVPLDYVAHYSILRVYKGMAAMKATILFPQRNPDWGSPSCQEQPVIFFLNRAVPSDLFLLADPMFGIRYFPDQVPEPENKTGGLAQLESDCAYFVKSADLAKSSLAITLLSDFDQLSETTISALSARDLKLDRNASVLRLEILARTNPDKYFDELSRYLPDEALADPMVAIRYCEVVEHAASPKNVDALEAIVNRPNSDNPVRLCAMSAIRRMKVPRTAPFLVKALEDPNLDVAYLAVIALADITDKSGDFGPGMQLFKTNPEKYRAIWRTWWQETGSKEF